MKQRLIDANALIEYCNNLVDKTIDANDIARFPTAVGWVSVKDRLPEMGLLVLVAHKVDFGFGISRTLVNTAMYQPYGFCGGGYDNFLDETCSSEVTHWMPLPTPPQEVTGDA